MDCSHGRALYELSRRKYEPLWINGGDHCDLERYPQYIQHLRKFIAAMEKNPRGSRNMVIDHVSEEPRHSVDFSELREKPRLSADFREKPRKSSERRERERARRSTDQKPRNSFDQQEKPRNSIDRSVETQEPSIILFLLSNLKIISCTILSMF